MGDKITINDWNGLNFRKIQEHRKELETYNGELPIYLHHFISIENRKKYLESIGEEYEYKNIKKHRNNPTNLEKDKKEIIKFVNENLEFIDIIKTKK